jgi:hypothetical protein
VIASARSATVCANQLTIKNAECRFNPRLMIMMLFLGALNPSVRSALKSQHLK